MAVLLQSQKCVVPQVNFYSNYLVVNAKIKQYLAHNV